MGGLYWGLGTGDCTEVADYAGLKSRIKHFAGRVEEIVTTFSIGRGVLRLEATMAGNHVVSFRDLEVWREAMEVVVGCYRLTTPFPKSETYGLTSQIQRAAVSIVANIAEGHPRPTNVFRHHVRIALGSQAELETLLELAGRLGLAAAPEIAPLSRQLDRIGRMLHRLAWSLERRSANAEMR